MQSSQRARIRFAPVSMTEVSPANDAWLIDLVERTPLLPERTLRTHWRTLIPWLPAELRYELAAVLLEAAQASG